MNGVCVCKIIVLLSVKSSSIPFTMLMHDSSSREDLKIVTGDDKQDDIFKEVATIHLVSLPRLRRSKQMQ